jgi:mRNA interferase MazF
MVIDQYQIVLVNLDPTVGSEIRKTRPCVVISPNELNHHLSTLVVAPMTSTLRAYPTRVAIQHANKKGMVALDQLRTIDKKRIVKVYTSIAPKTIQNIKQVLKETFVD